MTINGNVSGVGQKMAQNRVSQVPVSGHVVNDCDEKTVFFGEIF
jgi:hypothetical protein